VIVVAGLLCAIVGLSLGGLGGGGSVLALPLLVYVAGLPVSEAVTMSCMIVGTASAAACVFHARRGNVDLRTALLFGGAGAPGALLGAHFSAEISRQVLLGSFAVLLLGVSAWMGLGRVPASRDAKPWPILAVIGAGVGLIAGLFGVGGGFMIVPALTGIAGLPMRRAIGTSLLVIAMNSVASMFEHTTHATLPSLTASLFTSAAVVGALVGQRIAMRCSVCHLRRGFAFLILVVSGLVAWRVLDAL
jgi:uncharacterized membrane protein YfcA